MTSTDDVLLLIGDRGAESGGLTTLCTSLGAALGAALGVTIASTKVAVAKINARQGDDSERRTQFGEGGQSTAMVRGK